MIRTFFIFMIFIIMKEEILKLRNEGKTYDQICKILNCSKGTVSYYCGSGQKEKTDKRRNKRRENILLNKVDRFKYRKQEIKNISAKNNRTSKDLTESIRKFQKRDNSVKGDNINKNIELTFTWPDIINKFGENTICYLSGEKINLFKNDYNLDHIIPSSRGGDNSLENLGITHKIVNYMKGNLTPEELIDWCEKILRHNGYTVIK